MNRLVALKTIKCHFISDNATAMLRSFTSNQFKACISYNVWNCTPYIYNQAFTSKLSSVLKSGKLSSSSELRAVMSLRDSSLFMGSFPVSLWKHFQPRYRTVSSLHNRSLDCAYSTTKKFNLTNFCVFCRSWFWTKNDIRDNALHFL